MDSEKHKHVYIVIYPTARHVLNQGLVRLTPSALRSSIRPIFFNSVTMVEKWESLVLYILFSPAVK